jgi:hypothetical protein
MQQRSILLTGVVKVSLGKLMDKQACQVHPLALRGQGVADC